MGHVRGNQSKTMISKRSNAKMSSESASEAFAVIFMRWCMAAHIAAVTARITAFFVNGGSCRVRGRVSALY